MAVPRRSGVRGSVVRGESGKGTKSSRPEPLAEPEDVADPALPRSVVDFALQRRSALHTFFNGGALSSEFCDADTYLLRAAKFHGEPAPLPCRYAGIWALSPLPTFTAMNSGPTPVGSGKVTNWVPWPPSLAASRFMWSRSANGATGTTSPRPMY